MQKMLMETVKNKINKIETLKQRKEPINDEQLRFAPSRCADLVATQTIDFTQQSEEYIKLELNLKKIKLLANNFDNFESQSIRELNDHCQEQKRLVNLAPELKTKMKRPKKRKFVETNNRENIDKINKSNKELIEVIDNYEQTCINEFLLKISTMKDSFKQLVDEANTFSDIKQAYLNQEQTNDGEIRIFNLESIELQSKLNKEFKKQKYLIFNNKKIIFIDETDESIIAPIGYFDYDECFNVGYF